MEIVTRYFLKTYHLYSTIRHMKEFIEKPATGEEIATELECREDITLEQVEEMIPKLEVPNVTISSTITCSDNKKLFEYLKAMKALAQLNELK